MKKIIDKLEDYDLGFGHTITLIEIKHSYFNSKWETCIHSNLVGILRQTIKTHTTLEDAKGYIHTQKRRLENYNIFQEDKNETKNN